MAGDASVVGWSGIVGGIAITVGGGVILMVITAVVRLWQRDIERQKDVERIDENQKELKEAVAKIPEAMEHVAESFRDGMKSLQATLAQQGESLAYLRGRAEERETK